MKFSAVPKYIFRAITDISPNFLALRGINFLMLDLDNTIAPYSRHSPSEAVKRWIQTLRASGAGLFIVSNSRRARRVTDFADALGVGYIGRARKPSVAGIMQALAETGHTARESALVGDQAYVDALAANRAGVLSILVRPVSLSNPALAARYFLETPFRAACRNKITAPPPPAASREKNCSDI